MDFSQLLNGIEPEAPAPAPASSEPEAPALAPASSEPEAPAPAPASSEPEAPAPAPASSEPAPFAGEQRKLPSGVLDKPPPRAEKGKGKAAKPSAKVSHETRERFAETFGPLLDDALNVVAAAFGSPVRADNRDPSSPHNGLVVTVKFAGKAATLDTRREGVREAQEKARNTLGSLFTRETPGRAVAYHAAGIAPGVANLELWLEDHPWLTLVGVSVATAVQFSARVARSAPTEPLVEQNRAQPVP